MSGGVVDGGAAEVYAPDGFPCCPFCGGETTNATSTVMLTAHQAIETMNGSELGSEEYEKARSVAARIVGGCDV